MTYQLPEPAALRDPRTEKGLYYTAAQMHEAYAQGQRDMREKAAEWLLNAGYRSTGIPAYERLAETIRALPLKKAL